MDEVIRVNGYVLVDKQKNMTSFDVTYRARRLLGADKAGHTGTLDPFAEGLMIICLGRATKLAYLFSDADKTYHATVVLGTHYDTYDVTGTALEKGEANVDPNELRAAVASFVGGYMQVPPMYSAIKKNGRKLYDLARKGIDIDREPRFVNIHSMTMDKEIHDGTFGFVASVSKGTYIRSLAVDIARKLGTVGALKELRRLSIGRFDVKDAKPLDTLEKGDIIPVEILFAGHPRVILDAFMTRLAKNGVKLDQRQTMLTEPFVALAADGTMIGYYEPDETGEFRPIYLFEE